MTILKRGLRYFTMQKVFVWAYRIALFFPLTWLLLGVSWYCWQLLVFGEIPADLRDKAATEGELLGLNWFAALGVRAVIAAVWSFPFLAVVAFVNYRALKLGELEIRFDTSKILVYFLTHAIIWSLQLMPSPMSSYLNFLWDWTD